MILILLAIALFHETPDCLDQLALPGESTEVSRVGQNEFRVTVRDEVIETTRDPVIYVSRLRSLARRLFRR